MEHSLYLPKQEQMSKISQKALHFQRFPINLF